MNNIAQIILAIVIGIVVGVFFFGGLIWTVKKGLSVDNPRFLYAGSLILRIAIVLIILYLIASWGMVQMVVYLGGFVLARLILVLLTRKNKSSPL